MSGNSVKTEPNMENWRVQERESSKLNQTVEANNISTFWWNEIIDMGKSIPWKQKTKVRIIRGTLTFLNGFCFCKTI